MRKEEKETSNRHKTSMPLILLLTRHTMKPSDGLIFEKKLRETFQEKILTGFWVDLGRKKKKKKRI